jgi:hypothetical protein
MARSSESRLSSPFQWSHRVLLYLCATETGCFTNVRYCEFGKG